MVAYTVEIEDTDQKKLFDFVNGLGGKVVANKEKNKITKSIEALSKKEKDFLKGFEESLEFVKLHQQGKVKAKPIEDLLNEL